jgi:hypothetical protein
VVVIVPKIWLKELNSLERAPASPAALNQSVWDVLSHSVAVKAKVDSINTGTGEYRIVLQGTLDPEEDRFDKT